jgi:TfoX/Sxy family transcriptional regulator of competence genes
MKAKKKATGKPAEVDPAFASVVEAFAKDRSVTAGKLMSSYGLKVSGKIFVMFGRGKFVAKVPRQRVDELVSGGVGERFDPGHGRLMKEWIAMESRTETWLELAREAYKFVKAGKS